MERLGTIAERAPVRFEFRLRRRCGPEMRPDLRRPGPFNIKQIAEVGGSRPPPAAQVLVFNEMNAIASRCDVFECRDPVGKPVIEVGNLEPFDERGKSLELDRAMQSAELVVPDIAHVAKREGILRVTLLDVRVLTLQRGCMRERAAYGHQDGGVGEHLRDQIEACNVGIVL